MSNKIADMGIKDCMRIESLKSPFLVKPKTSKCHKAFVRLRQASAQKLHKSRISLLPSPESWRRCPRRIEWSTSTVRFCIVWTVFLFGFGLIVVRQLLAQVALIDSRLVFHSGARHCSQTVACRGDAFHHLANGEKTRKRVSVLSGEILATICFCTPAQESLCRAYNFGRAEALT